MCIYKITLHQKSSSKAVVQFPSFSGNPTFPNPATSDMYCTTSIVNVFQKPTLIITVTIIVILINTTIKAS